MLIQWFPIFLGYLLTSIALIAEHIAMWSQPWRLDAPWNYIVGVCTILAGCGVWAATVLGSVRPDEAWIAFAVIAVGSGKWIALAHYVRGRLERQRERSVRQGEIVGGARGLITELEGYNGTDDPSRHN